MRFDQHIWIVVAAARIRQQFVAKRECKEGRLECKVRSYLINEERSAINHNFTIMAMNFSKASLNRNIPPMFEQLYMHSYQSNEHQ
jgi:hypothetical protein